MTCTNTKSFSHEGGEETACLSTSKPEKNKFPDILHFFFRQNCRPLLESMTLDALQNIQEEYFNNKSTHYLETLKGMVSTAAHDNLMALFLLLLNVDAKLKSTIWEYECEQHYRKIERFLMDLKTPIVAQFCVDDLITVPMFVEKCWEAYVLA